MANTENLKLHESENDCDLVWDCTDGVHIVYFDYNDGEEITENDTMIKTKNIDKAEKVFNDTKKYIG